MTAIWKHASANKIGASFNETGQIFSALFYSSTGNINLGIKLRLQCAER